MAALFLGTSRPSAAKRSSLRGRVRGRPWTAEEDAQLLTITSQRVKKRGHRVCKPIDWAAAERAIPGRSRMALVRRAQKLRRQAGRLLRAHWTAEEDTQLREAWTALSRRTILEAFPLRSWEAIVKRATRVLGLPTVPQGWALLAEEARACGLSRQAAETLVAWANAWEPLVVALCAWGHQCARIAGAGVEQPGDGWEGGGVRVREHTTTTTVKTRDDTLRRVIVERGALEEALERWEEWEDSPTAASRWNVAHSLLRRWADRQSWGSLHRTRALRMPALWWDELARSNGVRRRGRTISEHAARRGMDSETIRRRLLEAGVITVMGRGKRRWILDEDVEAALVARPLSKCGRAASLTRGAA